jgi:pimeloyl-ACP methyl ester carboxylesterase
VYRSGFKSAEGRRQLLSWYDQVHRQSKLGYDLLDVHTRYGATRVAVSGNTQGEPLVFLHGWSGNGMLWELSGSLHGLADRYRIYLVDVIGQPNYSSLLSPPVRGKGYGFWLSDVLDQLQLKAVTGIGMSFGGFLWVKAAQVMPERIRSAVFLGPAGFTNLRLTPQTALAFGRVVWNPNATNTAHFVRTNILGPEDQFPEAMRLQIEALFQRSFQGFKPGAQLPYVFSAAELAALRFPCLFLCGEHDALFDARRVLRRAQEAVPGLEAAEVLPGLGHALGNSDQVVRRIDQFLADQGH